MNKIKEFFAKLLNDFSGLVIKIRNGFFKFIEIIVNAFNNVSYQIKLFLYNHVFTKWKIFKNKDFKEPVRKVYKHVDKIFEIDTYRLIQATRNRFISLVAIVFIGTAFMMGLLATAPIMRKSVDIYDDENNLHDIQIYSNYGFNDDDLKAIGEIEGIEDVKGSRFVDCYATNQNGEKVVVRVQELDGDINQIILAEGRMPEKDDECLAIYSRYSSAVLEMGDEIVLSKDNEGDLDETLKNTKYTIVGLAKTPEYLSEYQTYSTFHNLSLENNIFVPNDNLISEYYTTAFATVKEAKPENSFHDVYFKVVEKYVSKVEDLALVQKDANKENIINKALEKIATAQEELDAKKAEYEAQFSDAKKQLDDANVEVQVGKETIEATEKTIAQTEAQIASQRSTLDASKAQLDAEINNLVNSYGKSFDDIYNEVTILYAAYTSMDSLTLGSLNSKHVEETKANLDDRSSKYASYEKQEEDIKNQMIAIQQEINNIELDESLSEEEKTARINELQTQYDTLRSSLVEVTTNKVINRVERDVFQIEYDVLTGNNLSSFDTLKANIRSRLDELAGGSVVNAYNGIVQIKTYQIQIEQGYKTVNEMQASVDASKAQIAAAKNQIIYGENKYYDSLEEYEKAVAEFDKQIEDAETEIKKAEQDLYELSEGKWTILDRNSHYSSALYKSNTKQMQNIGIAFPILFFLVAALVCMTTMTRLIDEQRGQIGCLVALGYSKNAIIGKYVKYAGLAALIGAIPGVLLGILIFPTVIYSAWGLMYRNPKIHLYFPPLETIISFLAFIVLMCVVTYFVAKKSLNEIPAALMRPKAPKAMRKTFLEKINFIWKRLSFTSKITARNIIRYKQRFFMTVIGVAGCCGLLLIGFGVTDSISSVINDQYNSFFHLTHQVTFNDYKNADTIEKHIIDKYDASAISKFLSYSTLAKNKNGDEATATIIISDVDNLETYMSLTKKGSNDSVEYTDTGVVVTNKFATNNNLKIGDVITIESKDGLKAEVHVETIATMYYDHFIIMTDTMYYNLFGSTAHPNNITFITEQDPDAVSLELLEIDSVDSVINVDELTSTFRTMVGSLDMITLVIIFSAGFLALIVLINLTEVNISERRREIATLKVLGFRPLEVQNYIYKELIILTVIGSILGIPFGNLGLKFIMSVLNIDMVYFPCVIKPLSYLFAIAITFAFLAIILLIERKPLNELKMVESLKSVE